MPRHIHATAMVDAAAELGEGVSVGAYSIIEKGVRIGDHSHIDSHVVISGHTSMGKHNHVASFCSLGAKPQDLKYRNESSRLVIGDHNSIREYTNISLGTENGGMETRLGSHNLLMTYTHVGHDAVIGDHNILANRCSVGGHVRIKDYAFLAAHTGVHQHCAIGSYAMVTGGSNVSYDVPPCVMAHGLRAAPRGLNTVLLRRQNFSTLEISEVKKIYRILYLDSLTYEEAVSKISELSASPIKELFVNFFPLMRRGIMR